MTVRYDRISPGNSVWRSQYMSVCLTPGCTMPYTGETPSGIQAQCQLPDNWLKSRHIRVLFHETVSHTPSTPDIAEHAATQLARWHDLRAHRNAGDVRIVSAPDNLSVRDVLKHIAS